MQLMMFEKVFEILFEKLFYVRIMIRNKLYK